MPLILVPSALIIFDVPLPPSLSVCDCQAQDLFIDRMTEEHKAKSETVALYDQRLAAQRAEAAAAAATLSEAVKGAHTHFLAVQHAHVRHRLHLNHTHSRMPHYRPLIFCGRLVPIYHA